MESEINEEDDVTKLAKIIGGSSSAAIVMVTLLIIGYKIFKMLRKDKEEEVENDKMQEAIKNNIKDYVEQTENFKLEFEKIREDTNKLNVDK